MGDPDSVWILKVSEYEEQSWFRSPRRMRWLELGCPRNRELRGIWEADPTGRTSWVWGAAEKEVSR